MAGVSYTDLEAQYGELSGGIPSQWGEDVMASIDDKVHMSEQTAVQTVQGPINFSKSASSHTFVSPVNFNSTIITPNSNNLASLITAEVSQLLNINTSVITAGEWSQLANIGAATISAAQWGYLGAMDQNMYQTATVTFAGVDLVNTVNEFSTDDTLAGDSDTAVPTEQAVKTYIDKAASISSSNQFWADCLPYVNQYPVDTQLPWRYINYGMLTWSSAGGDVFIAYCFEPTNKGGKALHISGVRIGVRDADGSNYVSLYRVVGFSYNTNVSLEYAPGIDIQAPEAYEDTFTPVDASSYNRVALSIGCILATPENVDICYIQLRCHYE